MKRINAYLNTHVWLILNLNTTVLLNKSWFNYRWIIIPFNLVPHEECPYEKCPYRVLVRLLVLGSVRGVGELLVALELAVERLLPGVTPDDRNNNNNK